MSWEFPAGLEFSPTFVNRSRAVFPRPCLDVARVVRMAEFDAALREFETVQKDDIAEFTAIIREQGASAIPRELQRRLEKWKEVPLNVGVTGVSGVGKSTFINAVRRLKPSSPGAAAVGVTETTSVPTPYAHPHNPKVLFWDLPGAGTPRFPKDQYLNLVGFEKYDFFIIICSDRFTENDLWLAKEIGSKKKRFYFARTKMDRAVSDDKDDHPETHSEKDVLKRVRQDCEMQLSKAGFHDQRVFLICKTPHLYDFPKLEETFVLDIPGLKREVALYSVRCSSEAIIKEKTKALMGRCWKVAAASAAVAIIPIPGLTFAVDIPLILGEIKFYKQTYGLDDESLGQLSAASGVSMQSLSRELERHEELAGTSASVAQLLSSNAVESAGHEVLRMIPFIGWLVAGPRAYETTNRVLGRIIASAESVALTVIGMTIAKASAAD